MVRRRRRAQPNISGLLIAWLKKHNIDPEEACNGMTALQALIAKLIQNFGGYSAASNDQGDLCTLGTDQVLVHRDDARLFLWGKEVAVEEPDAGPDESAKDTSKAVILEESEELAEEEEQGELDEAIKPVKRAPSKKKKPTKSKK